jgi:hypothetical protein
VAAVTMDTAVDTAAGAAMDADTVDVADRAVSTAPVTPAPFSMTAAAAVAGAGVVVAVAGSR